MARDQHPSSRSGLAGPLATEISRRRVLAIAGIGVGATFLSACGGGSSASPSEGATSGTPKKGGTLRVSFSDGTSDDSLDPGRAISMSSSVTATAIFDQLATMDQDFQAQPALAKSWDVSPEATKWTIQLRDDVTWHDGSDFTSKDVVYTISRWLDPDTGSQVTASVAPYLDMDGVSAPDDYTVVLKLTQPNSLLMQTIANLPYSAIVQDGANDFTVDSTIGTGPFKLTSWEPGVGWQVVRNDDYWGGAPYLDGVDAKITPDQSAKLQAALSGSTDVTDPIPISLWAGLEDQEDVVLETIENRSCWVFAFDQTTAPFNDQRVLDAIKLATDRETIVQTALLGNGAVVADVPIDPTTSWYPADLTPDLDAEQAKDLLAQAGFSDGLDITLSVSAAVPGMVDVAQAWQQVVKDAGINVTLDQLPLDTYWTKGWMGSPAFMDYWFRNFPPVQFDAFYAADATFPETGHSDPEVDELAAQVFATTDPAEQIDLTQQAFLKARESFSYLIPMYSDAGYARAPEVNGVLWSVAGFDFRKTWLS